MQRSPFEALPGDSRNGLLALSTLERLPRRYPLMKQDEPVESFVLLGDGRVGLERARSSRSFPIGHRGPGETIGETAVVGPSVATENATVLDEAEVLRFPILGLRKLIAADASVRAAMTVVLLEQRRAAEARLESLLLHGVEARLVDFIIALNARWGVDHAKGRLIRASMTHSAIAQLIGSTRETVTLLLGKLKREGVIDFERRRLVICSLADLKLRGTAHAPQPGVSPE